MTLRKMARGYLSLFGLLIVVWSLLTLCLAAPVKSQVPSPSAITSIRPGQVQIIATYVGPNGRLVSDTTLLTVVPVPIADISLFSAINPTRWVNDVTVGKSFCPYAIAVDSSGNILTGRKVVFKSTDTTVARISVHSACPDTTVNPANLAAPLPVPPVQIGSLPTLQFRSLPR